MPYATFTYEVERARIVKPDALWVLRARAGAEPPDPVGVPSPVQRLQSASSCSPGSRPKPQNMPSSPEPDN
jgi:hypothetical protein